MQNSYLKVFDNLFFDVEKNDRLKKLLNKQVVYWIQLLLDLEKLKMK